MEQGVYYKMGSELDVFILALLQVTPIEEEISTGVRLVIVIEKCLSWVPTKKWVLPERILASFKPTREEVYNINIVLYGTYFSS